MFFSIPPSKKKKKKRFIFLCVCVGTCMCECRCPGSLEETTGLRGARVTGRCGVPAQFLVTKPGSCERAVRALNPHHFSSLHSTAVLRQGLSLNVTSLVRLAGQGALPELSDMGARGQSRTREPSVCLPTSGITDRCNPVWPSRGFSDLNSVLMLVRQVLHQLNHLSRHRFYLPNAQHGWLSDHMHSLTEVPGQTVPFAYHNAPGLGT